VQMLTEIGLSDSEVLNPTTILDLSGNGGEGRTISSE